MSKELPAFTLSLAQCEQDLGEFRALLDGSDELSESGDILPFFVSHPNLAALAGSSNACLNQVDRLASEFDLFGNFRCDWAVGDSETRAYTLIEFEDARANSVFARDPKYHDEWGRRLEHGFSQMVDWFWVLDSQRGSPDFNRRFGAARVQFFGLLVVGRRRFLQDHHVDRLEWRRDRVVVDSHKIACVTFDELYDSMGKRIRHVLDHGEAAIQGHPERPADHVPQREPQLHLRQELVPALGAGPARPVPRLPELCRIGVVGVENDADLGRVDRGLEHVLQPRPDVGADPAVTGGGAQPGYQ